MGGPNTTTQAANEYQSPSKLELTPQIIMYSDIDAVIQHNVPMGETVTFQ